jgi:hypothetical protein
MKMFRAVWLALFAVCAFAASASAEVALWLFNGANIEGTTQLLVDAEGSLFVTVDTILGKAKVHCSRIFDGWDGANGTGEVTSVLSLNGEEISRSPLVGLAVDCEVVVITGEANLCGEVGLLAEVWPDNPPWPTSLELMEEGGVTDILEILGNSAKLLGWHVLCPNGTEALCEGIVSALLTNEVGGTINAVFPDQEGGENFCSNGGKSLIEGEGLILHTEGGELTVSDP